VPTVIPSEEIHRYPEDHPRPGPAPLHPTAEAALGVPTGADRAREVAHNDVTRGEATGPGPKAAVSRAARMNRRGSASLGQVRCLDPSGRGEIHGGRSTTTVVGRVGHPKGSLVPWRRRCRVGRRTANARRRFESTKPTALRFCALLTEGDSRMIFHREGFGRLKEVRSLG
jgi:hypothetical protein